MKIFHFKEKLDSLSEESNQISPPLHVRIKPTNICNHDCWYCAYRADNLQLGQDMNVLDSIPRIKMLEIVEDLAAMGVRAVTFSGGGDPFCYPHLLETVERLRDSKIRFAALTNGSRLYSSIAEFFAHHATWLRISMDGWDNASYAAYRNCPDDEFSRVLANMETFKKIGGKCYLGVGIVVDIRNFNHIYDLIRKLQGIGVDSVKVSPCIVSNSGAENNAYHDPICSTVKEQIAKAMAEYGGQEFEINDSYHKQLETFSKTYHWCPYLQISPVIGADLNVYTCHDKAYNIKDGLLGSISDKRFKEFWSVNRSKFYGIDPAVICNHHCVADSSNLRIIEYLSADKNHLDFV
jgi:MoaA/NifB/PqqE/SkfB family radical SAM enzyme